MSFVKVKSKRLYEDIVSQIRERIYRGEFKVGSRMPSERELIEDLGVSKASLREAFRVLEADGLIYSQPGGGRFVRFVESNAMFRATVRIGNLEKQKIFYLLEAREAIECRIAQLAAMRATPEDVEKLRAIIEQIRSGVGDIEGAVDLFDVDTQFHKQLAIASQNPILFNWLDLSIGMLQDSRKRTLLVPQRQKLLVGELTEIFKAIIKKNPIKAASTMRKHIRAISRQIKKLPDETLDVAGRGSGCISRLFAS